MVRVSVAEHVRISLQLVAARYAVRPQDVLDNAALLFVIVAERSLPEHERRLQELNESIDNAEGILSGHSMHFGGSGGSARNVDSEDPFWARTAAPENRDVFWNQSYPEGPFIDSVRTLAKGLPNGAVGQIASTTGGSTISS